MNKIGKYYSEARATAQQRKSPWNWLLFPLSIIGIGGSGFLLFKTLLDFQHHLIPSDAIYSSGIGSDFLMFMPLMFLSLPLGFIFANFSAWCLLPARRALDKEAKGIKGASFQGSMKPFYLMVMILLPTGIPLACLGEFNYFYISSNGIYARPLFSTQEKHFEWRDIKNIHGKYSVDGGRIYYDYIVFMKDGMKINLSSEHPLWFIKTYNKIKPFLEAQSNIVYDYVIGNKAVYATDYSTFDKRFIKNIQNNE